ncbi:MAG: MmcQ/YjbR family DNA-binding protein [Actinomycetota bacterium]|nr:MmcQ/YjbR family DNA-binding protein [Actinomycetota bacterium]
MVTEQDIRQIALSLPGSAEKPYNRLPSFRVRGTLFLRIHELPDAFFIPCGSLEERDELLRAGAGAFFITPHYEGYPGVLVRLSQIDLDEMTELVTEAWRLRAPKRVLAAYDAEHPPAQ